MKLKKDKYWTARGSSSKLLVISCAKCGTEVFVYQKDGIGGLHRCYANRIHSPAQLVEKLLAMQESVSYKPILCSNCLTVIAAPHIHTDGRLAFNLIIGTYTKAVLKKS